MSVPVSSGGLAHFRRRIRQNRSQGSLCPQRDKELPELQGCRIFENCCPVFLHGRKPPVYSATPVSFPDDRGTCFRADSGCSLRLKVPSSQIAPSGGASPRVDISLTTFEDEIKLMDGAHIFSNHRICLKNVRGSGKVGTVSTPEIGTMADDSSQLYTISSRYASPDWRLHEDGKSDVFFDSRF